MTDSPKTLLPLTKLKFSRGNAKKKIVILVIITLLVFFASLFLGRYPLSPGTVIQILLSKVFPITPTWSDTAEAVVFDIRAPRAFLALLVGASLSASGAAFQGMFRNPLVSPDILGVSSAAGFGAALAILFFEGAAAIQISAFLFGIVGVLLTYLISRVYKSTPILMLVLSGVVVSAFFSALISSTKFIADPTSKLPEITFWLMGSLSRATWQKMISVAGPMLVGMMGLVLISWRLNVIAMGDEEAQSLGVKTELVKTIVIICSTVVTASAVCVSGMIGWVGLIIPHIGRMLVGPDHRKLIPISLILGAIYLLIMDTISRTVISSEIPLGILTAIIGAPFFAILIRRTKGGWG